MIAITSAADRVIRRWPTDRSRHWLVGFLDRATRDRNVLAVVVVGSAVRPGVSSEDLDLIVVCRDRNRLREKAPIEVDLRSYDLARVEAGLAQGQDLLTWAVRYGESIYDPTGAWEKLATRWADRVPLPDSAQARRRASAALTKLEAMRVAGDAEAVIDLTVSYLTHLARATLAEAGVYPASRPELPDQLRRVGHADLADRLAQALAVRAENRLADVAV